MVNKFIKLGAAVLIGLLLGSCSKPKEQATQKVTFYADGIETGKITRVTDHDAVIDLIENTYPTIKPTLYYSDTESFDITLGQSYDVKIGNWRVNYDSNPESYAEVLTNSRLTLKPRLTIDTFVDVQAGISQYVLPVTVHSVAFVFCIDEISTVYYCGKNQAAIDTKLNFQVASGNYMVFFMDGEPGDRDIFEVRVVPSDVTRQETIFRFSYTVTTYNNTPVHKLVDGTYYVLHPEGVTEFTGSFSVDNPVWTCSLD